MEQTPLSIFERINNWIRESIMLKLLSIGILILILLIPQAWIQSIISEREYRADEVVREIAAKWSGSQTLTGPVISIPYRKFDKIDQGKDGIRIIESRGVVFFLPEALDIGSKVQPKVLSRGIFESAVYESTVAMKAQFLKPVPRFSVDDKDILWSEATLVLGISDLRGISENPRLMVGTELLSGEPSNDIGITAVVDDNHAATTGVVIHLPWKSADDFVGNISFDLNLKGSDYLYFAPVGKTTEVKMAGPWSDVSFDGEFLPDTRSVNSAGFSAAWKILHFNRPFAQTWTLGQQSITGNNFGAKLLIPVEQYQKSIRTAKYGILVILLTFVSLFMVELIRKIRIHPVQYILVGSALIVYYVLLISLSEQIGYDLAYLAATVATIALVTAYSMSFLPTRKTAMMFCAWMAVFYTFIFIIIREQDYSLLIGSVGLFLIVGAIMYLSRSIQWYGEKEL